MTLVETRPSDPELAHWADLFTELRWAAFLLDAEFRLVWASPDVQRFLGFPPAEELQYGRHVLEALTSDAWRRLATSDSGRRLLCDLGPYVIETARTEATVIPEEFHELFVDLEPRPFERAIASYFDHVELDGESDLAVARVNTLAMPLRDGSDSLIGVLIMGYMSLRPGLVSLLARGDEAMYERMAKLVEPSSHEAAVLFCDLQGSTDLARTLPTGEYFRLIRSLWTEMDQIIATHQGIVGKHAGDGASAFFLEDDLGSPSAAAGAALRAAREIHDRSQDIFGEALDTSCLMRIGLHWGSSLYIGQLVPGGRLDVTALGDAVNECARIQECAEPHGTLVSKQLIERLSADDAAELGIDPDKVRYQLVSGLASADDKAIAAAGAVPVTQL
jgi:class 3 adenylate cyclase